VSYSYNYNKQTALIFSEIIIIKWHLSAELCEDGTKGVW